MHYLYFVKIKNKDGMTSKEARREAYQQLENNSFAGEGGFFSNSKADWYVIGGRWSGHLTGLLLKGNFHKESKKLIKPKEKWEITDSEVKTHTKELQKLWEKMGGKNEHLYNRNSDDTYGVEDDAQIITPDLLKALKKAHSKPTYYGDSVEVFDPEEQEEYLIKDLKKDCVGEWLVVIDYHN